MRHEQGKLSGTHNLDPFKLRKREVLLIPGHEVVSLSREGALKEAIVMRDVAS